MKNIIVFMAFLLIPSSVWSAGGPWDGIYTCGVTLQGKTSQVYVTINGYPDGQSIYVVAAVEPYTAFYGFGVGNVYENTFVGTTNFGAPFSLTSYNSGFYGTVGIVSSGYLMKATASCIKIW